MYSAVVIGAGPVGSRAAFLLKQQGFDCALIEEHKEIGKPVSCSGLISKSGTDALRVNFSEGVLVNRIKGAKIHSKNQTLVVEKPETVAYVIDRAAFDVQMANYARKIGVEVMLDTKLLNIRKDKLFVEREGRGELLKADFFIGADGAVSKTRDLLGIKFGPEKFIEGYQVIAKGSFEPEYVELFFGDFAQNFFAWIIPESRQRARIGLGTSGYNARESFEKFVSSKSLDIEVISRQSGLIPVGEPIKKPLLENILIAGNAAFHAKATTGGGILSGMEAAACAASAIASYYKEKEPVDSYVKRLQPLYKDLNLHFKIRSYLNSISSEKLDRLFEKAKKAGIEDFLSREGDMDKPSKFMKKIWLKPKLWPLLPEFLKI